MEVSIVVYVPSMYWSFSPISKDSKIKIAVMSDDQAYAIYKNSETKKKKKMDEEITDISIYSLNQWMKWMRYQQKKEQYCFLVSMNDTKRTIINTMEMLERCVTK